MLFFALVIRRLCENANGHPLTPYSAVTFQYASDGCANSVSLEASMKQAAKERLQLEKRLAESQVNVLCNLSLFEIFAVLTYMV